MKKTIENHKLEIDQEEVNWRQKPHPTITGKLDGRQWTARFLLGHWAVHRVVGDNLKQEDALFIRKCLEELFPEYLSIQKEPHQPRR